MNTRKLIVRKERVGKNNMSPQESQWNSKIGFILAAAGSAIGLGAIWKFPYVAGTGGGGAFFFIFMFFILLLGFPALLGEFIIGRKGKSEVVTIYKKLAPNTKWHFVGRIGIITNLVLLSFYSVIGGWIILYLFLALTGRLNGLSQNEITQTFVEIIANPFATLFAQAIFMLITILVVAKGIQQGIEKASKIMMPALFILFLILVIRSLSLDGAMEGVKFLFYPDFSKMTSQSILFALGQAFFTLSIGACVMVTYATYLPKSQNLPKSALSIILMNVLVCVLAGLAIFPGVFSFNMEPDAGPTLIFTVLPIVFSQMSFGMFFFIVFLILFLFAALTSAFSMIEMLVATFTKNNEAKRYKTTWITGIVIFIIGIPSCLSYGVLSDVSLFGKTIFDIADFSVSNILLPFGALFVSIFVSTKISRTQLYKEMKYGSNLGQRFFKIWFFVLKYVTPIAIIIVFLDVSGVLNTLSDFFK